MRIIEHLDSEGALWFDPGGWHKSSVEELFFEWEAIGAVTFVDNDIMDTIGMRNNHKTGLRMGQCIQTWFAIVA